MLLFNVSNHRLVRKFRRNLNDYGPRIAFQKGFLYFSKGFFEKRTYRIYAIDIENWTGSPVVRDDLSFHLMNGANRSKDMISQIEFAEEWLEGELEEKLQNGSICLVALDGTKVAGFNLVSFGDVFVPLIDETIRLKPEEAWSEHIAVFREYRRRGLARSLRYNVFDLLEKRRIKRFYGGTLTHNESSLKLARSAGFTESIDIHFLKVLGRKRLRCGNLVRPVSKKSQDVQENACRLMIPGAMVSME
jgi:ribosomal protein S18 acetylase RimI-like enzyme